MLGANLGSAVNPVFEGAHRDNPASYRLPLGNLANRLVGVLLVAPFLHPIVTAFGSCCGPCCWNVAPHQHAAFVHWATP